MTNFLLGDGNDRVSMVVKQGNGNDGELSGWRTAMQVLDFSD